MNKNIYKYEEIRDKIMSGVEKLAKPVVQTLTPYGKNVIYQNDFGDVFSTNDGYTITRNIKLEDPVEDSISEIIKHAAWKTNRVAGDGTTTSVLLSWNLIKNGFRLIDNGMNQMELKRRLDDVSGRLIKALEKNKKQIKDKKDLEYVAMVSSNNDPEIAKNVSNIVEKSGEDGMVFLEDSKTDKVEIEEEDGFLLEKGMFSTDFSYKNKFSAIYLDAAVFITNKRLYYEDECIEILSKAQKFGYNNVVIVAKDFIGSTPDFFASNHNSEKANINILPIKEGSKTDEILEDLATYLGTDVVKEKKGSFVDKLTESDFGIAKKVFSTTRKTIITKEKSGNKELDKRIKELKQEKKNTKDKKEEEVIEKRIANMKNGIVTIKIGAKTIPELREKHYRYEDAVSATKSAMKHGYVPGGGITLFNAFKDMDKKGLNSDLISLLEKYCESPLKQIAINTNNHFETMKERVDKKVGYNAVTHEYEDLLEAGIIEPFDVIKNAVENSISVAQVILSSDFLIVNKIEEDKDN